MKKFIVLLALTVFLGISSWAMAGEFWALSKEQGTRIASAIGDSIHNRNIVLAEGATYWNKAEFECKLSNPPEIADIVIYRSGKVDINIFQNEMSAETAQKIKNSVRGLVISVFMEEKQSTDEDED